MNNKLNNMLNEFFANKGNLSEEELNKELQKFMFEYNAGLTNYENTPLDDAYELLEKAENAKSKKQAIKFAKEAYEMCPACFDAIMFQVDLEEDYMIREKLLDEGLEKEEKRLKDEGYFEKDNIGHFYGIFETRPYIRGLYHKALDSANCGKLKLAKKVCKEILRLNENDNTGSRYLLMAVYACLEEEKDMLALYKKYPENNLEMLFPLLVLYFKQGDYTKAKSYLDKINKNNPHFIKFFKGNISTNKDVPDGYFSKGDASEVLMYTSTYTFLLMSVPGIVDFVLQK